MRILKRKAKKPKKMIDPPRFPRVTNPIDESFKSKYNKMLKGMFNTIKAEMYGKG